MTYLLNELVKRLRSEPTQYENKHGLSVPAMNVWDKTCHDAANEIERLTTESSGKDDYWRSVLHALENDIYNRLRCVPDKSMHHAPVGCSTSVVSTAFRALNVCQWPPASGSPKLAPTSGQVSELLEAVRYVLEDAGYLEHEDFARVGCGCLQTLSDIADEVSAADSRRESELGDELENAIDAALGADDIIADDFKRALAGPQPSAGARQPTITLSDEAKWHWNRHFQCPKCGSRFWGTSQHESGDLGHCHDQHSSGCGFWWHRNDDENVFVLNDDTADQSLTPDARRRTWWCPQCSEKSDDDGIVRNHKESCCHYGSALAPPATSAEKGHGHD